MIKLIGVIAFGAMAAWATGSESHVGSPNPEAEELMEESYGAPEGISLPEVQVVRFLGQHFPEMLVDLEKAEAQGEKERKEVLDRARGIILEWEEHERVGDEVAESFIGVERLHYQNDALVAGYVKMEEGPEKKELGNKLRANLKEIHAMRTKMEVAELARLKEEIAVIEDNLKYSGENLETMVETELRDLLEFWRMEQAGEPVVRRREKPVIPGVPVEPAETVIPAESIEDPERVEVARPVEDEGAGGGFVERRPEAVIPEEVGGDE